MTHPLSVAAEVTPEERRGSALAYLLTWITGIIVFLVARPDQRYMRWNALQAIGLGLIGMVLAFLGSLLSAIVFAGAYLDGRGPPVYLAWGGLGLFGVLVTFALFVLVLVAAFCANRGGPLRIPLLARIADRYA